MMSRISRMHGVSVSKGTTQVVLIMQTQTLSLRLIQQSPSMDSLRRQPTLIHTIDKFPPGYLIWSPLLAQLHQLLLSQPPHRNATWIQWATFHITSSVGLQEMCLALSATKFPKLRRLSWHGTLILLASKNQQSVAGITKGHPPRTGIVTKCTILNLIGFLLMVLEPATPNAMMLINVLHCHPVDTRVANKM